MADLDDFFAKKDKKKKSKKGFSKANTDILAKNLEENERREAKAEEKVAAVLATTEANKAQAASEGKLNEPEEEWRVYDDEKKDYSGLKIEALKIESEEEFEEDEEHEINEEGEKVRVKKQDGGPWNRMTEANNATPHDYTEQERKEMAKAELEASIGAPKGSVVGGSYVPPHMRGGGGQTVTQTPTSRVANRRNKAPPDFNSQVYFPALSSSAQNPGDIKESDFEEVRGGNTQHHRTTTGPSLALGNKYSVLRDWKGRL